MRGINRLTPKLIAATRQDGRYADGLGLYLEVRRAVKSWSYRYMVAGRARELGLGPCHSVSLAEARLRAREARQLLIDGKDPIEVRHAAATAAKIERLKTVTFREAALDFLKTNRVEAFKNAKHRAQWRSTLEQLAFPTIGDLPLNRIDTAIILKVLSPVLARTPETGSRLRGRIARVFDWAAPLGLFKGENPASQHLLKDHLPAKAKVKHHSAMPYAELPGFMAELRKRDSVSARALEFAILTASRTSEALGARWEEVDVDAATWVIPAERMKAGRPHRVPLSERALAILKTHGSPTSRGFIFPGAKPGAPLSDMALLQMVRGMAGNYTTHGFRSSFSDWSRDRTSYSRDVVEGSLAHAIKDKSESAYRRGDALEKRSRLMQEWSRYCEAPVTSTTVTPIGVARQG
jgi:integrase